MAIGVVATGVTVGDRVRGIVTTARSEVVVVVVRVVSVSVEAIVVARERLVAAARTVVVGARTGNVMERRQLQALLMRMALVAQAERMWVAAGFSIPRRWKTHDVETAVVGEVMVEVSTVVVRSVWVEV